MKELQYKLSVYIYQQVQGLLSQSDHKIKGTWSMYLT